MRLLKSRGQCPSVHVVRVGRARLFDLVQILCDQIVKSRLQHIHHEMLLTFYDKKVWQQRSTRRLP